MALEQAGYHVHIVFTQHVEYLIAHDLKILEAYPKWTYDVLNWANNKKLRHFTSALIQKFAKSLSRYVSHLAIYKFAINRNYLWQIRKAILSNADLYIAHNLAALPVAFLAAQKTKSKCGFDAEDFHRQETTDNIHSLAYKTTKGIEDELVPQLSYLTTASPLITTKYFELYPNLIPITINNVFSIYLSQEPLDNKDGDLKLFWFSQTIGKGRGLEDVLKAIGLLQTTKVTLYLLGNVNALDKQYLSTIAETANLTKDQLNFIAPVAADEIFKLAVQCDIGLALEQVTPLNRDICLTNKIFTYLTSGLAIIASETSAQKQILSSYPDIGQSYEIGNIKALADVINQYNIDRALLYQTKLNAILLAKETFNWEKESKVFIKLVQNILDN